MLRSCTSVIWTVFGFVNPWLSCFRNPVTLTGDTCSRGKPELSYEDGCVNLGRTRFQIHLPSEQDMASAACLLVIPVRKHAFFDCPRATRVIILLQIKATFNNTAEWFVTSTNGIRPFCLLCLNMFTSFLYTLRQHAEMLLFSSVYLKTAVCSLVVTCS